MGDLVSLNGKVSEFRSSSSPGYLFMTEITSPTNITVVSSGNVVTPVILGKDRSPPTQLYNSLDAGPDGWLSVPNNVSLVSAVNATLEPTKYGMDFWESLEGQLVTIPGPTAAAFQNSYGEFWVYGSWNTTGKNARGGLTITFGAHVASTGHHHLTPICQVLTVFLTETPKLSLLERHLTRPLCQRLPQEPS